MLTVLEGDSTSSRNTLPFVRQFLLIILSGLLVAVSFPPLAWWPCILPAYLILLLVIRDASPKQAFYWGCLQGLVAGGVSLYWLVYIFKAAAISLHAILALFIGIFCVLCNLNYRRTRSPFARVLIAATLWTAVEFLRSELFILRFSWLTPGLALGPTWLTPWLGAYGASFLLLAAAAGLVHRPTRAAGVGLTILLLLLGWFRPPPLAPTPAAIKVAAVQYEEVDLDRYLALTRGLTTAAPRLVVWPEYAVAWDIRKYNRSDLEAVRHVAEQTKAVIVLGTKTQFGKWAMKDWYNTALTIDRHGVLGEYYKNHPVHFFNDGVRGRAQNVVATPLGTIGTPICFDFDFVGVLRRMTLNGAEFFAIPSFDAAWWSANQHLQHSAILPLRAAENGRWVVCAASSGISQIVDPHGRVRQSLAPLTEGTIIGTVERSTRITFFTRAGWLLPWFCCAGAILWLAGLLFLRGRNG